MAAKKKCRSTKTAERARLMKERRRLHRKLRAKKAAKAAKGPDGNKRRTKTHPHRRTSALR